MTQISDLLHAESIRLDAPAEDWEDAIRIAGGILEQENHVTAAYTEAMVTSVRDNGPYIVVAPGFAFAHARPSEAVLNTQMSLVRLVTPVAFGHPSNDPVDLVVALAAADSSTHTKAMAQLAKVIGNPEKRERINTATTADEILAVFAPAASSKDQPTASAASTAGSTRNKILTVCGNGLGTSLFLKNTLDQVLAEWKWSPFITTEATDTISAKGKAKEADCILTSGEIGRALGDVGIPVYVIQNFTSADEIDAALRELYDV